MTDLLTALGLMFLIEGAAYCLFPEQMKRLVLMLLALPASQMRLYGLVCALSGFLIIGTLRGF